VGTASPGRPSRAQLGRFGSNLSTLSDENSPRMLGRVLRYARSWKSGPSGPRQQRVKSGFSPGSTAAHLSSSLTTLPSCRRLTRWPTRTRHSATSLRNSESKSTEEYSMSLHTWLNSGPSQRNFSGKPRHRRQSLSSLQSRSLRLLRPLQRELNRPRGSHSRRAS